MTEQGEATKLPPHMRVKHRDRTLRSAAVIAGASVWRCIVLDLSTSGARIAFASPVNLPVSFALRLRDGATYPAVKRWEKGLELGVQFTAPPDPSGDEGQVRRAAEALHGLSIDPATGSVAILRAERFLGDEHLRDAVEVFEQARERLIAVLRPHAARPQRR